MVNKLRSLVVVLVCFSMLFSLAGCKNNEQISVAEEKGTEDSLEIGMSFDSFVIERWQRDRDVFVSKCKELIDFIGKINPETDLNRLYIIKNSVYYMPEGCESVYDKSIRFLRTGLQIGEIDKNIHFKPSQALALSLDADNYPNSLRLARDDVRLEKYLRGETIFVTEDEMSCLQKGYVLICVDSYGLGFAKLANNMLKNLLGRGFIIN